jgi:hypothetical protein
MVYSLIRRLGYVPYSIACKKHGLTIYIVYQHENVFGGISAGLRLQSAGLYALKNIYPAWRVQLANAGYNGGGR